MADITPTIRDDADWVHSTWMLSIGKEFSTYNEAIEYTATFDPDDPTIPKSNSIPPGLKAAMSDPPGPEGAAPAFLSRPKCRDTSLGGNEAINPYPAFNEDDDIIHPFTTTSYGATGMGRVYSTYYDDTQRVMYLRFGVPVFNNLSKFYNDSIDPLLATLMNKGATMDAQYIGQIVGNGLGFLFKLPFLPIVIIDNLTSGLTRQRITKYYDFEAKMPLYKKIVNGIIIHLAVNLGLATDYKFLNGSTGYAGATETGSTITNKTYDQLYKEVGIDGGGPLGKDGESLPEIFKDTGFDIHRILNRKYYFERGLSVKEVQFTDELLKDMLQTTVGPTAPPEQAAPEWWEDNLVVDAAKAVGRVAGDIGVATGAGLRDASEFIGFRVEKSVDSSESFSNQTGESEIAQKINSIVQGGRNRTFSTMALQVSENLGVEAVTGAISAAIGAGTAFMNQMGMGAVQIMTGSGIVDIPEVWTGSSFSKSYSFNMPLRAIFGDPVSIMSRMYVPLACLLGGVGPRAVGPTAYTSPFLVQAYCKGMFAVALGMIVSMTVRRGGEQHGWNYAGLPTAIDVSLEIKDLSPALFLPVSSAQTDILETAFGDSSAFQEYLLTLSGMGLAERTLFTQNIRRRIAALNKIIWQQKLSVDAWGGTISHSWAGRLVSAIMPTTAIPRN